MEAPETLRIRSLSARHPCPAWGRWNLFLRETCFGICHWNSGVRKACPRTGLIVACLREEDAQAIRADSLEVNTISDVDVIVDVDLLNLNSFVGKRQDPVVRVR